jgi:hypothetical protein
MLLRRSSSPISFSSTHWRSRSMLYTTNAPFWPRAVTRSPIVGIRFFAMLDQLPVGGDAPSNPSAPSPMTCNSGLFRRVEQTYCRNRSESSTTRTRTDETLPPSSAGDEIDIRLASGRSMTGGGTPCRYARRLVFVRCITNCSSDSSYPWGRTCDFMVTQITAMRLRGCRRASWG